MKNLNKKWVILLWLVFFFSPLFDVIRYQLIREGGDYGALRTIGSIVGNLFEVVIVLVFLYITLWTITSIKKRDQVDKRYLFYVLAIGVGAFVISNAILNLEQNNYPNFVYSKWGIRIQRISVYSTLGLIIASLSFASLITKKAISAKNQYPNFGKIAGFTCYVGLTFLITSSVRTFLDIGRFKKIADMTYEQKFGNEYNYIHELRTKTPTNSNIILPPQSSDWPVLGNQPIVRYFLFPRTLYSSVILAKHNLPTEAYFVWIRDELMSWPIINFKNKCVVFTYDTNNCISYKNIEEKKMHSSLSVIKIRF